MRPSGRVLNLGKEENMLWTCWEKEEALLIWGNLVRNSAQMRGSVHGTGQPPSSGIEEEREQAFP